MSSRNAYLGAADREAARVLSHALRRAVDAIVGGERDATRVAHLVGETVSTEPRVELEYIEVRDAHELTLMIALEGSVLIALAARVGSTRLIDNVLVEIDGSKVSADLGVVDLNAPGGSPCSAR